MMVTQKLTQTQQQLKSLDELYSKENKNSNDKAKIQAIVQKLNASMKDLNLQYDAEKDALNMSNEELKKRVNLMLQEAKMNAAKEDLEAIAKEQYQREKELNDLLEERTEIYNKYTEAKNAYDSAGYSATGIEFDRTDEGMAQVLTLQKLGEQIKTTRGDINDLGEEYQKTYDFIENNTSAYEEAAAEVDQLGTSAEETGNSFDAMEAQMQEAMAEMAEDLQQTITNQIDLFDAFEKKTGITKDNVLANMESQVKGIEEWADNIEALATRGIDQGLLLKLENMGPQGAAYVEAFTKMSDEELKKASELFQKSMEIPADTTAKLMDAYETAGRETGESYKKAVEEKLPEIEKTAEKIPQQTSEGIKKTTPELETTIKETADKVSERVEEDLDPSQYEKAGKGIIDGIAAGVKGSVGVLQSAIDSALGSIIVDTGNIKIDATGLNANIRSTISSATADAAAQASQQQVTVDTNVYLEGDAKAMFNMVRQETQQYVKSTGYNPLTQ